jgi:hypothetical protein
MASLNLMRLVRTTGSTARPSGPTIKVFGPGTSEVDDGNSFLGGVGNYDYLSILAFPNIKARIVILGVLDQFWKSIPYRLEFGRELI